MTCKHCKAAREALYKAKILEAIGHAKKAVAEKTESRRVSRTTPPAKGKNAQE